MDPVDDVCVWVWGVQHVYVHAHVYACVCMLMCVLNYCIFAVMLILHYSNPT